jgi:putative hemolysin
MTPEPAAAQAEPSAQEAIRVATSSPVSKPAQIAVAYSSPIAVPPVEPVTAETAVEAATPTPTAKEATTPGVTPTKAALATTADPGGVVEVTATKAGLTRIGAVKCKLCHQVQFASWTKTAHASRVPPLDCESCHGAGSEYKALAIMKDPKKARAAGMVNPEAAFCAKCHTSGVTNDFLKKAHAHKAGA